MKQKYDNITCGILTRLDLAQNGKRFLECIQALEIAAPSHIGNEEPIREPFHGAVEALSAWRDPFLWRNAKTKTRGSVWMSNQGQHSCIYIHLSPNRVLERPDEVLGLLEKVGVVVDADFGYVHYTTEVEFEHPASNRDSVYAIDVGVTSRDLQYGIPNVCWGMFFGEPYRDVVRNVPASDEYEVRWLQGGRYASLHLALSLSSVRSNFAHFLEIRNQLASALTPRAFGTKRNPAEWLPDSRANIPASQP